MTHIHFSYARSLALLASVSLVSLLTACGTPDGGYYNEHGTYIPTDTPHNMTERAHAPLPGGNPDYHSDRENAAYYEDNYPHYTRRGYYDYNGYYIESNGDLEIPKGMFPHRGMCRVWFTDRLPSQQPAVESCNSIQSRVPAGAYVIYGG